MNTNKNSSNPNKIKSKIIRKMQQLFNGKAISSKDIQSEALDMSLSDEQEAKSTVHDNLKVDFAEVEALKQIIYSEANKDLTTKLEDMKKQLPKKGISAQELVNQGKKVATIRINNNNI